MGKRVLVITKVNLINTKVSYYITGITALFMLIQTLVIILLVPISDNVDLSIGNFLFTLPILAAIFIPARNFRRIVNLGAKRNDFLLGSLLNYIIFAAFISLANLLTHYTIDFLLVERGHHSSILNLIWVFGWTENGAIIAFIQQFAFLFLVSSFIHTLTSIQDKWYGWVTDIVLIAIISVFTPIAPLRSALAWFFNLIITHSNSSLQIAACILLSLALFALNKPIYSRKVI